MSIHLKDVSLDDKYKLDQDRVYINGIQALVRLPLMQKARDEASNLNTAGFISGYRGSPLGGLDINLMQARKFLNDKKIHFQPGLNEDLAMTAVWGSQQTALRPTQSYDGVFAMWYGKGPGVDRSGDVIKHANAAGTAKHGGILLLCGDDHSCKSSTFPHQSEHALIHSFVPMLNPASIQDILDMGLFGFALSRYSGLIAGFKCLADTMDSSASVYAGQSPDYKIPTDFEMPDGGLNIRWPDIPVQQEQRILEYRLPAARAFARANDIDKITLSADQKKFALVATGKAYSDLRQALELLHMDEKAIQKLGLCLYKVGMVWPLETSKLEALADECAEILIFEEKRPLIEDQLKSALFNRSKTPKISGKKSYKGEPLMPDYYELNPFIIAKALITRLKDYGDVKAYEERLEILERAYGFEKEKSPLERVPYYCSGCPHNTSTKVPEGSRALAGIGCHYMASWIDENTATFTQMGGEGVPWIGQAPFLDEDHIFANLGDGTYQHSGLLAIRACVAANVNITYKILYNDAVAMTGGQKVEGVLTVDQISKQVAAEGVGTIFVISDDIEKYKNGVYQFAKGVTIRHREEMMKTQKELREKGGVSVIIYDQTCAAEKRRRRKRGQMADPKKRVVINEMVCEGCGDCGKKSNCVSILPVETEYGRKRQIDQSSCNKDYSCLNGFCPSFVTIEGSDLKKPKKSSSATNDEKRLPEPEKPSLKDKNWSVLLTGIGGTGVVTIGALLAMAAHIEGKGGVTMDQIGLAQKGGAVMTHMRFGDKPENLHSARIGIHQADALIAADIAVAAGGPVLAMLKKGQTKAVLNSTLLPPGQFTKMPDLKLQDKLMTDILNDHLGNENCDSLPASELATRLLGNSIATNLFMVGFIYQKGAIPLSEDAILKAIELNNVAVPMNKRAFYLGRLAAHDLKAIEALLPSPEQEKTLYAHREKSENLDQLIERRVRDLTDYQNKTYAQHYFDFVKGVREQDTDPQQKLVHAVARYLYKLMAYKDEYEVARLYTQTSFKDQIKSQFEAGYKVKFHLAPPLFAPRDKDTGELKKIKFGSWMFGAFGLLAKLKFLRATPLDIFGYSAERKTERQLIEDYKKTIQTLLNNLKPTNYDLAVEIASIPEEIRGFGHVKEAHLEPALEKQEKLLKRFYGTEDGGLEKDQAAA